MDRPTAIPLRIGAWYVNPASGQISRDGETVRLEARTMRLLLCLAEHAGEVVSIEELLEQVWSGVIVTPDSVYQAIASLRRQLGDDPKEPTYIATVPRLGYRMVAPVSPWVDEPMAPMAPAPAMTDATSTGVIAGEPAPGLRRRAGVLAVAAGALCVTLIAAFLLFNKSGNKVHASPTAAIPPKSVAVLPFLDLTSQKMDEEYFADGMTEELIDKLSKIPGLHVPAPASSFYFKGRRMAVADMAKSLGVVYVLSGSVRESDAGLRVAVRLVRADDGYVVWAEVYDRPSDNKLLVQEQIAVEVTKALKVEIN
jgi:transcriptional activator of cad operon